MTIFITLWVYQKKNEPTATLFNNPRTDHSSVCNSTINILVIFCNVKQYQMEWLNAFHPEDQNNTQINEGSHNVRETNFWNAKQQGFFFPSSFFLLVKERDYSVGWWPRLEWFLSIDSVNLVKLFKCKNKSKKEKKGTLSIEISSFDKTIFAHDGISFSFDLSFYMALNLYGCFCFYVQVWYWNRITLECKMARSELDSY